MMSPVIETIITFLNGSKLEVYQTVAQIAESLKEDGTAEVFFSCPAGSAVTYITNDMVLEYEGLCI